MLKEFFLLNESGENLYTLSSTMDNFRLTVELENGKELKLANFFGEGLTIRQLDELTDYIYDVTKVTPPPSVPAQVNKPAEPDYINLLDNFPEKFFKLLVLENLQTAQSHNLPDDLKFQLKYTFNYLRVCHVIEKSNFLFCAIDETMTESIGPLNYYRGLLFADKSHVYGIIRVDNLGKEFYQNWNSRPSRTKLYLNQNNKMLLVKRFPTNQNGGITYPDWQDFFTRDFTSFVKMYKSTL